VSGSISIYLKEGESYIGSETTLSNKITVTAAGFSTDIYVVFLPINISGAIGPIVTELPFVGVDKAFGA